MKIPSCFCTITNCPHIYYLTFFVLLSSGQLISRIGDSKSKLEGRLLKSNGIVLRDDDLIQTRQTGMIYLDFEEYFPKPYQVKLYFKSSDGSRPKLNELANPILSQAFDRRPPPRKPLNAIKSPDKNLLEGWELHVLYVKGYSVLEVYKKTSEVTEHEIKHLLALQSGNSFWIESTQNELSEGDFSAFGFSLLRNDGYLRMKKLNSRSIMIFRSQTDQYLFEAMEKEKFNLAPESIKGF